MAAPEQTTSSITDGIAEIAQIARQSSSANHSDGKWRSTYAKVMLELSYKAANRKENTRGISEQQSRVVTLESNMAQLAIDVNQYSGHMEHSQAIVAINTYLTTIDDCRNQSLKKTSADVFLPNANKLKKTEAEITDGIRTLKNDLSNLIKNKNQLVKEANEMIEKNETPALIEAKLKQAEKQISTTKELFEKLKEKTQSLMPELNKLILDLRTALDAASVPYTPVERPSAPSI